MKLVTPHTSVGRYFVGVRASNTVELICGPNGFDTYEDAVAQLKKYQPATLKHEFFIFQAVGQFKARAQFIELQPSE